jgi:hypothetical protein
MTMFLALALKRDCHPPENILKFNVPRRLRPFFRALAKNMVVRYAQ